VQSDQNFKTPQEVIHLLAATAARGGNLLLNVGPDGQGRIPERSLTYLREVGRWLARNGASIYGTKASPIPDQPWGVSTLKDHTLFLHVFTRPRDGILIVPAFAGHAEGAKLLGSADALALHQDGDTLAVTLPAHLPDERDSVVDVTFSGTIAEAWGSSPAQLSRQFDSLTLEAAVGSPAGATRLQSKTSSRYFGNWKHDTVALNQAQPTDTLTYAVTVREAGDYRVSLDYACTAAAGREGVVQFAGQTLAFETAHTGDFDPHEPLLFLHHTLGVVTLAAGRALPLVIRPSAAGPELFWLRRVVIEPVR
jgi:alpha-L-fucosidase